MAALWESYRVQLVELARLPGFTIPSFALPVVSYLLFGLPQVDGSADRANYLAVSFAAFAVLGIVMFQFGVGVAVDRNSPWERLSRTLTYRPSARLAARLVLGFTFALVAVVPVAVVAIVASPLSLSTLAAARTVLALFAGVVPLGVLGIALGYLVPPKAALPVTNLFYLPLAYIGGLFGPPRAVPEAVRRMRPFTPTGQWNDVVQHFGFLGTVPIGETIGLMLYGLAFLALAWFGYQRDEATNYR
jgi:ABC-2 type transport system permease protein